MPLLISIATYFFAAALLGVAGFRLRKAALAVALAPFVAQLTTVGFLAAEPRPSYASLDWIPSLGVTIGIEVDTLSLLLTTVVAAIGLLIVMYTWGYTTDARKRVRFLALMLLFSGGMAGIVASDQLFGLFIFWEITTIASFLLIGFDSEKAAARAAAVQAVLVTTAGGLAMLAGFVLLADVSGSTSIPEIVAAPPTGPTTSVAIGLVLLGAFTKSAQFPFHFWLPGAMAAPTPASAYLHSATMVKAGIVLLVLLAPGFSSEPIWLYAVTGVGLFTMVLGAWQAMRQHDLKLLLAHGTVSQLGFMVALIGLGAVGLTLAVLVAHAIFKAALFLVVGTIDKLEGTRDIRRLTGLGKSHRGLAAIGGAAALSMAGVPPLLGFVSKEAAFDGLISNGDWLALSVSALASALTVAYTARFWFGAFGGRSPDAGLATPTPAPWLLVVPPGLLAAASIVFGLLPKPLEGVISSAAGESIKLVLWPGFKPALAVSALVLAAGAGVYVSMARPGASMARLGVARFPDAQKAYRAMVQGLNHGADVVTAIVQNGSLPVYVAVILTTVFVVPAAVALTGFDAEFTLRLANNPVEIALTTAAIVSAIAATRARRRMAAALLLGAVGYMVAGIYLSFGAPDLALTQLLIETFTVALFALVLAKLPRRFGAEPRSLSRPIRLAVAILAGVFVTAAALAATSVTPDRSVAEFYVNNAVEAGGRNVVNVILTDFRALDTLGEITVLAAAAIGIGALGLAGKARQRNEPEAGN